MTPIKLTIVLLPFITFLSNYFRLHNLPEGILMVFPSLLLLASLVFKPTVKTHSQVTPRIIIALLLTYTYFSGLVVIFTEPELGIKPVLVQGVSFSLCLWLLVSNHLSRESLSKDLLLFCKSTAVVALLYVLIVIPVLLSYGGGRGWAYVSTDILPNRNDLSLFFLVALCGFIFLDTKWSKLKTALVSSVVVVALLLTFSRSSYSSLFLISIFVMINSKYRIWVALLMVFVVLGIFLIEGNPVLNRLEYTFGGNSGTLDDSTSLRVVIWEHALQLAYENPVFGVGHGRSPFWGSNAVDAHGDSIIYAHNYFITQFFQLGLVGVILTLAVFGMLLYMANFLPKPEKHFIQSVVIIFLAMSISGDPMYGYSKFIFLILYSALLNRQYKLHQMHGNIIRH